MSALDDSLITLEAAIAGVIYLPGLDVEGFKGRTKDARAELATLRATIAQQQKRIEAGERVAEEFAKVEHNIVCEAGQYGVVEPCTCDLAPLAKALDAFRKSALTKAFTELSSTVDAIRTREMEQSAMTKIADESGNDPPIGVEP